MHILAIACSRLLLRDIFDAVLLSIVNLFIYRECVQLIYEYETREYKSGASKKGRKK